MRNLSLTVRDGEFVLILGPSGCGKSTLLQLLNGTIPHTLRGRLEGEASVCGKPILSTKVASFATEVGMVFQDPEAQIINTRVRDEVCFGLENLCRPAAEILERQREALDFVGLDGFGDRSIFDLSGGQKQRVSIADVLAARPASVRRLGLRPDWSRPAPVRRPCLASERSRAPPWRRLPAPL